jgi:hypothetical protein
MIPARLDFGRLKRTVSVEQVLADKGWLERMRRRGTQIVGPCPVHRGDNPNAFVVDRDKKLWHCFTGCDGGGDVVELARRLSGGSYRMAASYLASLAGSPNPPLLQRSAKVDHLCSVEVTHTWIRVADFVASREQHRPASQSEPLRRRSLGNRSHGLAAGALEGLA